MQIVVVKGEFGRGQLNISKALCNVCVITRRRYLTKQATSRSKAPVAGGPLLAALNNRMDEDPPFPRSGVLLSSLSFKPV